MSELHSTFPKCYRCGTIVEKVQIEDWGKYKGVIDAHHMLFGAGKTERFMLVAAYCHGQKDGVEVPFRPWWASDPETWDSDTWIEFNTDLALTPFFRENWYKTFRGRDRSKRGRIKLER